LDNNKKIQQIGFIKTIVTTAESYSTVFILDVQYPEIEILFVAKAQTYGRFENINKLFKVHISQFFQTLKVLGLHWFEICE